MNNSQIISTAMAQSATDLGCAPEDFIKAKNIIVESTTDPNARKYLKLPFICDLVSYGNNIVASVDMKYKDIVEQYINRFAPEHCFETPN
ncbi:MAG: GNAT family N-acetyltransferase, partial [Oscillospiraceae bacterium]|nr:GNAT family N-acetyltransferase [Oscillospiraceae bacterium]